MRKFTVILICLTACFWNSGIQAFANEVIWQDIGRGNLHLKTVWVDPDNAQLIYIGSGSGIFKTNDGGENWRNILSVRGQNKGVNFLLSDAQDKKSVYAATGNGLFYSANQGKDWKRIFRGKNYLENECTALAVLPAALYLGTKGGLFVSKDKGRTFHKETTKLGNTYILAIAYSLKEPGDIYVVCADGVFKSKDSGQSWERTFVASPTENDNDVEEITEDRDEAERFSNLRYISIDPNDANYIYLATDKGVYQSQDRGLNWEPLSNFGLLHRDVKFLLVSHKSHLYAVTKSGIFEYREDGWQELSLGLVVDDIRYLAQDKENNLYVACDKGLFKANLGYVQGGQRTDMISLYSKGEPNINDVQQAAIKYAEVEPEKIIKWRQQAGKKALLPQVSIGIDRNSTDLWHWEGGSTTKTDDDILRRGRDSVDWDVTLSWDLGEFIWNDDQAAIDVRSRLMVQLRDDILDEVTKLYFERLRVKIELDNLSIEDRKKRLEKELRLEELTASLDALTGGYFSQQIKSKS